MALRAHESLGTTTAADTAELLGITQPRVSDLMRGKIDLFGIDMLVVSQLPLV